MLRSLWPSLAKGTVGFFIGLAFWWAFSAPYGRMLAAVTEPLIRLAEDPAVTRLIPAGTEMTINRTDFPPASARPGLRLMDLTFNIVLLTTLFAASPKPFSNRNVAGFLLASLALVPVHVAAIVVNVHSIYALQLGPWSDRHYGPVARNFWGGAAHFYNLVGVFGAAFALWWLLRPSSVPPPSKRSSHGRSH